MTPVSPGADFGHPGLYPPLPSLTDGALALLRTVASGSLGGQCLSLADYVTVTGTRAGATAAGGPFMLPSLSSAISPSRSGG